MKRFRVTVEIPRENYIFAFDVLSRSSVDAAIDAMELAGIGAKVTVECIE